MKVKYRMEKKPIIRNDHFPGCSECKYVIAEMFRELYGTIRNEHKFQVSVMLKDYKNEAYYDQLAIIMERLEGYRGYRDFVRLKKLRTCDLYVENPGFIVELDEIQHFTAPRKVVLSLYPKDLVLGFDKRKWVNLCRGIDARDNDKKYPFRDEQRGWYDTIRDFLPLIIDINPTVRIYMGDYQWCDLDPKKDTDVGKFIDLLPYQYRE